MAKKKQASGKKRKISYAAHMHHFAWGVVCAFLLVSLAGVWIRAQVLEGKASDLEKQLLAAKRPAPSTCKVRGDWKPGTTTTMDVDKRGFLVRTPSNFVPYEYYPLVMFYPGKGGVPHEAEAAYGLDNLPAIVVYPFPTLSKDGFLAWQGAPYSSDSNDVAFTAAILDKLQDALCIDRTKVYAIGMSNGGGFASLLSCKLPDRFAAYAIIAGAMYAPAGQCRPPKPAPLISVHGDQDPIVPYDGSLTRQLPAIDAWTAKRAEMNGCKALRTVNSGPNTQVAMWSQCRDNATVQSIRVQGGRHSWGDVTNDALWQFLSRFSL